MVAWHRSVPVDLGLRASGLLLCGIAYAALSRLFAMHVSPQTAGLLASTLAALSFLGASAGSALAMLGHHLFDQISVGERWLPRSCDAVLLVENSKPTNRTSPEFTV